MTLLLGFNPRRLARTEIVLCHRRALLQIILLGAISFALVIHIRRFSTSIMDPSLTLVTDGNVERNDFSAELNLTIIEPDKNSSLPENNETLQTSSQQANIDASFEISHQAIDNFSAEFDLTIIEPDKNSSLPENNETLQTSSQQADIDASFEISHQAIDNFSAEFDLTIIEPDKNSSLPENNETLRTSSQQANVDASFEISHRAIDHNNIACTWLPGSDDECLSLLSKRILLRRSRGLSKPKFWFFFGDSTMLFMWKSSQLHNVLSSTPATECPGCIDSYAARCHNENNSAFFEFPVIKDNTTWKLPSDQEGPVHFGQTFPSCMDCDNCKTNILKCANLSSCQMPTGGYLGMEFSRDVELQTNMFNTTQENLAVFLRKWIKKAGTKVKHSICVINVALHDMGISKLDDSSYFANIKWMFKVFNPVCGHFIWIHTAAVLGYQQWPQTNSRLKTWNDGILDILTSSPHLQYKASFVDVFAASVNWKHTDNVHMDDNWYIFLGDMFVKLARSESIEVD